MEDSISISNNKDKISKNKLAKKHTKPYECQKSTEDIKT